MSRDTAARLLYEHQKSMRKYDPEYCLACVTQEALAEILGEWEEIGPLFLAYLKQEQKERMDYYSYCYQWGMAMGDARMGRVTMDLFPKLPERRAYTEPLDEAAKQQGGQLRCLWRRYQNALWKRKVFEGAYITNLGVEEREAQKGQAL